MKNRNYQNLKHAFMGWNFIPELELDNGGTDSSNNPWKGKNPKKTGKISRSQDAGALKTN